MIGTDGWCVFSSLVAFALDAGPYRTLREIRQTLASEPVYIRLSVPLDHLRMACISQSKSVGKGPEQHYPVVISKQRSSYLNLRLVSVFFCKEGIKPNSKVYSLAVLLLLLWWFENKIFAWSDFCVLNSQVLSSLAQFRCSLYVAGFQNTATAQGGDAMPPWTLSGALVKKKFHFPSLWHTWPNSSRFHSSPIGVPHWQRSHSCKQQSSGIGVASNAGLSDATAAKCSLYNHLTVSMLLATPMEVDLSVARESEWVSACLKKYLSSCMRNALPHGTERNWILSNRRKGQHV